MAIFDDFRQVAALTGVEAIGSPIIQNQEIAFFETQHQATIGWIRTIAAPLPDPRGILWEGTMAAGDDLEFWIRLTPYESISDQ